VPEARHENTFAEVNAVVARLRPQPEFICFPGDEIRGLTADTETLRRQWDHWFGREMKWLDRTSIPLYHTTGNHTTYDAASEAVFREKLSHLPRNGPPDQQGLAYFIRRGNLLMVFVNTMFSELGGEGRVETKWLDQTFADNSDARYKLVFGHHPVHPVNGFSGAYQREINAEDGLAFWRKLVEHQVFAYVCSHILAFDVQVHEGVLQILTAGAGTEHRMPEGIEYLHCMQAAMDADGLCYQVLDTSGRVREWLSWPVLLPPSNSWRPFVSGGSIPAVRDDRTDQATAGRVVVWDFAGRTEPGRQGAPQTLLCGWRHEHQQALRSVWVGLLGREQRLCVHLCPAPERSPHQWLGPELRSGEPFGFQVGLHTGMGPGGVLWRWGDRTPWSSLTAASPWGPESVPWPDRWSVGQAQRSSIDQPFRGQNLRVLCHHQMLRR
jgi:hypothetical protein